MISKPTPFLRRQTFGIEPRRRRTQRMKLVGRALVVLVLVLVVRLIVVHLVIIIGWTSIFPRRGRRRGRRRLLLLVLLVLLALLVPPSRRRPDAALLPLRLLLDPHRRRKRPRQRLREPPAVITPRIAPRAPRSSQPRRVIHRFGVIHPTRRPVMIGHHTHAVYDDDASIGVTERA